MFFLSFANVGHKFAFFDKSFARELYYKFCSRKNPTSIDLHYGNLKVDTKTFIFFSNFRKIVL